MKLADCTAVITGGTGNLGRVVTLRFLEQGARTVVAWRSQRDWEELEAGIPPEHKERSLGVQTDVTDEAQVAALMHAAVGKFGGIEVLLNLVGAFAFGKKLWDTDAGTWDR
ncbi:MAG: SDR family NAD(P)-dependent oxidoreductase, partial [Planctomycetota bacterium]